MGEAANQCLVGRFLSYMVPVYLKKIGMMLSL